MPLRRAPFVLWIVYTDPTNLMLHVSADPALADAVADGVSPARAVPYFDELMGMAEAEHNPDHSLYISQYGAHYLPPPDADLVRFNRVIWGAGFVAGGRDVARLFIEDLGQQLRLEQLSFDTIYLTAMHTRRDAKMRQQLVAGRAVGVRLQ